MILVSYENFGEAKVTTQCGSHSKTKTWPAFNAGHTSLLKLHCLQGATWQSSDLLVGPCVVAVENVGSPAHGTKLKILSVAF